MKALTLWRPWPWAILYRTKRIENRGWAPPASIIGEMIAIHAGRTWDENGAETIAGMLDATPTDAWRHMGIVGVARVTGCVTSSDDPWFAGPFGWTLDDVRELPHPIPCKGAQRLWTVPPEIVNDIKTRLRWT